MTNLRRSKLSRRFLCNPRRTLFQAAVFVLVIFGIPLSYLFIPTLFSTDYERVEVVSSLSAPVVRATHVAMPVKVKAIYMTACVAGTPSLREKLVKLIEDTELNAVVIDVKDYSGRLSFETGDPLFEGAVSPMCFAPDMRAFIESMHKKGIYTIGRITVFQDPFLAAKHPEWAVKRFSDKTENWKDKKGISYLDPASREVWDYIVALGEKSYDIGFDELNFDYIRFPSDGNMSDIYFPASESALQAAPAIGKALVARSFFAYLSEKLRPTGAVLSADLFGMTTTNTDDLNIGQVLEYTLPYFDFVAPMVYPSHYPPRFMGFANPAAKPYEVVKFSMGEAVKRAAATTTIVVMPDTEPLSTTTQSVLYPKDVVSPLKLRPWLQDFNLGATYTAEMVRAQIQATYDVGLDSWMLWNASNRYTRGALLSE